MESEGERYRKFSRRALLLAGAQGLLTAAVMGRMYYLGVLKEDSYRLLAEENRISLRLIPPLRGEILDRSGEILATNRRDFRVFLIPEQTADLDRTLVELSGYISLTEADRQRIVRQLRRQRSFLPLTVAENLDWRQFARLNVESPRMPGVQPDAGQTRHYPDGRAMAHVIGYVGAVSEEDLTGDPVLQLPGFKIGKSGLERLYESDLRGRAGNRQVEVNAYGRVIRELDREAGRKGDSLVLTIDRGLQNYIHERLGEESAAAIVMDTISGDVVAAASTPSYDANSFTIGISRENWDALIRDPRKPLVNKCVQGQYPPGSTFKMVVALAAMEAGVAEPSRSIYCSGEHRFGNRTFHCWRERGHGRLDMVNAIARSCDIYFYQIAEETGIDRIGEMARRLGLGARYDIGFTSEATGLIPGREWKQRTFGESWQAGETLVVGIGQGALLATPLQMTAMTARLAMGKLVSPRLVHAVGSELVPGPIYEDLPVNTDALDVVRAGMRGVLEEGGTAYLSRLRGEGLSMAGKTGTSQVRAITQEERDIGLDNLGEKPWRERDHALFVAYGPVENPRYALSVIVEHGGGGSAVAAPIARDIMGETLRRDPASAMPLVPRRRPVLRPASREA